MQLGGGAREPLCPPPSSEGGSELEKEVSGFPLSAERSVQLTEEVGFWLAPYATSRSLFGVCSELVAGMHRSAVGIWG